MKHIILILPIVLLSLSLSSQNFSIEHDTMEISGPADVQDFTSHNFINNISGGDIVLRWQRIEHSLSSQWETLVCDNVVCWDSITSTKAIIIQAGKSSPLDVHFLPDNVIGSGLVEILVFDTADSANTVQSAIFKASNWPTSITTVEDEIDLMLYPNPATSQIRIDGFNLTTDAKLSIYDIKAGRILEMETTQIQSEEYVLNISSLLPGLYIMKIINPEGVILQTKKFVKH